MDKDVLRNQLFEKYFDVYDGIRLENLVKYLSIVVSTYKELHKLLEKNIEEYESWDSIETIKVINYNQNEYLIFKISLFEYLVIDLSKRIILTKEDILVYFDEEFFINNFFEINVIKEKIFVMYDFYNYNGNIQELINFYFQYKEVFDLSNHIYYKIQFKDAWSYIFINLVKGTVQLGFETIDQFLYEHLFLDYDLTPSNLQDAVLKIGKEKMKEIFKRVKDIKIPYSCIPIEFYQKDFIYYEDNKFRFVKKIDNKVKK